MYLSIEFTHTFNSSDFRIKGSVEFKKCDNDRHELVFDGCAYLMISESLLPPGVIYDNDFEPRLDIVRDGVFYHQAVIPEIWKRYFNLPFQESIVPDSSIVTPNKLTGENNEKFN